jgi:ribosomal protein L5
MVVGIAVDRVRENEGLSQKKGDEACGLNECL